MVRQADNNEGGGDGVGLVPTKSRVQQLKAKGLSTVAAAAVVAADTSAGAEAGEAAGARAAAEPVATTTTTTMLASEGDPFLCAEMTVLDRQVGSRWEAIFDDLRDEAWRWMVLGRPENLARYFCNALLCSAFCFDASW